MVLGELDADGLWGGWDNMVGDGGMGVNAVAQPMPWQCTASDYDQLPK
jgi:hypothetical protein